MTTQFSEEALSSLARTDEEAAQRYKEFKSRDPFPNIPPALLNSADILDYVAKTGMVFPFDPYALSKPASYSMALLGKCVYWDESDEKEVCQIQKGDSFILRANSIAFVTLEPRLRLPDYLALRFNLRISHIYKGLLLGTGPLVDPGFDGTLSIPLHNLTLNDYTFKGGDRLIWVEFTKLSPNDRWKRKRSSRRVFSEMYIPFPERKKRQWDVADYLHHAEPHRSVRSSIPEALRIAEESVVTAKQEAVKVANEAREAAARAREEVREATAGIRNEVERISRVTSRISIIGVITVAIAMAALTYTTYTLVQDAVSYITDTQVQILDYESQSFEDRHRIQELEEEIRELRERLELFEPTPVPQVTPIP